MYVRLMFGSRLREERVPDEAEVIQAHEVAVHVVFDRKLELNRARAQLVLAHDRDHYGAGRAVVRARRDARRRHFAAEQRVADLLEGLGVVVDGQVLGQRHLCGLVLAECANLAFLAVLDHPT
jgi:predicted Ser/Thr protein kinase